MSSGRRKPQAGGFGELLRGLRQQANLTQERLAERTGLGVRTIAYLEGGGRSPRPATVRLLADALGLEGPARARFAAAGLALGDGHGAGVAAAASPTPVTPAQLPADVAGFTGRTEHLAHLDALLTPDGDGRTEDGQAQTVVISAIGGTAGVGKTALAVHWAHRVAGRFPDGQLHVNLHGWSSSPPVQPIQALAQLLAGLGVAADKVPVDVDQAAALYRSLLAGRRVLVVLDNARDPAQVRPLLPGSAGCLVVITSRDRLAGLVASHGARRLALDVLPAEEAVDLIGGIIGRQRLDAEPQAAAELARVCGLLPLALRIAAANLVCHPDWPVAGYVARLRAGDRLAELAVDGDPQAAVQVAFDSSYASLDADAQRLFRVLGLVPGTDVTAPAAAALAGLPTGDAARLLERLAGAHLLEPRAPGGFGLHDLLRAYARQRAELEESERERQQALERLLGWYLHTADAASRRLYPQRWRLPLPPAPTLPAARFDDRGQALAWLDAERANLVAAVRHAAAHGPQPLAWLLADTLRNWFWDRRLMVDWLAVAHAAVDAADAHADPKARSAARRSLGQARTSLGDYPQAAEQLTGAVAMARQAGWTDGEAAAVNSLGVVHSWAGRLQQAADCYARALALARHAGFAEGQAAVLSNLGEVELQLGRPEQAADHLLQALALWRGPDATGAPISGLINLAEACRELGRLDEAAAHLTQALAMTRAHGNRYAEADSLHLLAAVHRDAGRLQPALELAEAAVALADELADPRVAAGALTTLGSVQLRSGEGRRAAERYQQALRLACQTTAPYPETQALLGLAAALKQRGDHTAAIEHAERARTLACEGHFRILEGHAHRILAEAHLDLDRDGEAAEHAEQAVAIHRATGHRPGQARALLILGQARRRNSPTVAVERWQEALALLTDLGVPDVAQVRAPLESPVEALNPDAMQ
jgi:tetratricopeptide (TPR) repeat protein